MTAVTPTPPVALPDSHVGRGQAVGRAVEFGLALPVVVLAHTFDRRCPRCPGEHGGPGPCDHAIYNARQLRFIMAHREEYVAIHTAIGGSARALKERLDREYRTLPSRHDCTCNEFHCVACSMLVVACERCKAIPLAHRPSKCEPCERLRGQDVGVSIGRTSPVHAPSPSAELTDLLIARGAMRTNRWRERRQVVEFLNGLRAA